MDTYLQITQPVPRFISFFFGEPTTLKVRVPISEDDLEQFMLSNTLYFAELPPSVRNVVVAGTDAVVDNKTQVEVAVRYLTNDVPTITLSVKP